MTALWATTPTNHERLLPAAIGPWLGVRPSEHGFRAERVRRFVFWWNRNFVCRLVGHDETLHTLRKDGVDVGEARCCHCGAV